MASCALAASGWPRASAIGRRGVGALGPRSRWGRGNLIVWAGCVCDELFPPPRPGWEQLSFGHALTAVLCLELCGLESGIQLFDMAARRILEASFEKSAVPSGPRAGPSPFTPLWRGRDINVEPGPRLTVLGAAETCRLSLSGPIHEEELEGREGSGPRPRHASSHETDAPSPGAACPASALALASQSPCLAKEYGAATKLTEGCARACWITSRCRGTAHQWHGREPSLQRPGCGGARGWGGAGLSRQDTLEAELQAIIEPWRPSKPRACAAGGATLDFSLARHRDQVASTIPLIPETTNWHRPARKEHGLRR